MSSIFFAREAEQLRLEGARRLAAKEAAETAAQEAAEEAERVRADQQVMVRDKKRLRHKAEAAGSVKQKRSSVTFERSSGVARQFLVVPCGKRS